MLQCKRPGGGAWLSMHESDVPIIIVYEAVTLTLLWSTPVPQ